MSIALWLYFRVRRMARAQLAAPDRDALQFSL